MHEQYLRGYRALYDHHWWWRTREEVLTREIARLAANRPLTRILDVGCGDGLFFPELSRFGDVHGVEPVTEALDPNGPWRARIHAGPLDAAYQPAERFDLVLALDVIEHLADPHAFLREIRRLIAPDGWFVATVPAFRVLWTAHDDLNEHVARFTKDEFTALLNANGFSVVHARYFFVLLFFAKLVVRCIEAITQPSPRPPVVPAAPVNALLTAACRLEMAVLGRRKPWVGSSLLVVARVAS